MNGRLPRLTDERRYTCFANTQPRQPHRGVPTLFVMLANADRQGPEALVGTDREGVEEDAATFTLVELRTVAHREGYGHIVLGARDTEMSMDEIELWLYSGAQVTYETSDIDNARAAHEKYGGSDEVTVVWRTNLPFAMRVRRGDSYFSISASEALVENTESSSAEIREELGDAEETTLYADDSPVELGGKNAEVREDTRGSLLTREWWDRTFEEADDIWGFEDDDYESRRAQANRLAVMAFSPRSLIDVGCHEAHGVECIVDESDHIPTICGLDISPVAVGRAKHRVSFGEFRTFDWNKVWEDESAIEPLLKTLGRFDVVLCAELLYYLGEYAGVWYDNNASPEMVAKKEQVVRAMSRLAKKAVVFQHAGDDNQVLNRFLKDCGAYLLDPVFGIWVLPTGGC